MKRFYKTASTSAAEAGWAIYLDGRGLKTPEAKSLTVPTSALACAIVSEWNGQDEQLDIAGMVLTRLANVAIDRAPESRDGLANEFVSYCSTDLVAHLTDGPPELLAMEEAAWAPVRDWASGALGIGLETTRGISAIKQPSEALAAARLYAERLDDFSLTGLIYGAGLFGSALLSAALREGAWTAEEIFEISEIDSSWQRSQWGDDEEAMASAQARMLEAQKLAVWFDALRA